MLHATKGFSTLIKGNRLFGVSRKAMNDNHDISYCLFGTMHPLVHCCQ